MTKENKGLIISTAIVLIVAALMILTYHFSVFVPGKAENKLFGVNVSLKNEIKLNDAPTTGEYSIVLSRYEAVDGKNKKVGDVFYVKGTNGYTYSTDDDFGVIELYVGISITNRVSVQVLNARQTTDRVPLVYDFVSLRLQDVMLDNIETIQVSGGGLTAGATHSRTLVKSLVMLAVIEFKGVEPDPYEGWFEAGYQLEEEIDLTGTYLQYKRVVLSEAGVELGAIYVVKGEAVYHGTSSGSIEMHIGIDNDGKIIGYHFGLYQHTSGFRADVVDFLDNQVLNTNINTFDIVEGIETGASNSSNLIIRMLTELKGEVN